MPRLWEGWREIDKRLNIEMSRVALDYAMRIDHQDDLLVGVVAYELMTHLEETDEHNFADNPDVRALLDAVQNAEAIAANIVAKYGLRATGLYSLYDHQDFEEVTA